MITAVDTSVLLDEFLGDERFGARSREWLREAYTTGAVLVCDVVYAELVPAFGDQRSHEEALGTINATTSSIDTSIAYEAGRRWGQYRRAGGTRTRVLADFLIGAHALATADAFLTRNRGFYATYFPELNTAD